MLNVIMKKYLSILLLILLLTGCAGIEGHEEGEVATFPPAFRRDGAAQDPVALIERRTLAWKR